MKELWTRLRECWLVLTRRCVVVSVADNIVDELEEGNMVTFVVDPYRCPSVTVTLAPYTTDDEWEHRVFIAEDYEGPDAMVDDLCRHIDQTCHHRPGRCGDNDEA